MKFCSTVALFLIAVALTQAAPTHDDPAWDRTPTPEETPAHETILADVSYATAKKHVTQMLQAGKDEDACKDLSKATSDEVIASVAAQQKTLDGMLKGEEECDDEGEGLVLKAQTGLKEAQDTQQTKTQALADANSQKINFGDFEFDQLQEGQCTSFFNQKVWQDAKAAVATATTELNTANGAVTAAEKALTDAQDEAAKSVSKCRCSASKLLEKTVTEMNANAKVANTKAWKEAAHMLCVIDGNPEDSCSVPTMPTVKAVEVSDKVQKACGIEGTVTKDDFISGGMYGGKKFSLTVMKPKTFASDDVSGYEAYCKSVGLLVVGCGTSSYDCQKVRGKGNCISVPAAWSCNSLSRIRSNIGTEKRVVALCTTGDTGCSKPMYSDGPTGGSGYTDTFKSQEQYPVCGKYLN